MPTPRDADQERTKRVDALVAEYVAGYHRGGVPCAEDLVDAHPDIAEDLAAGLAAAEAFLAASDRAPTAEATPDLPGGVCIDGYEIIQEIHRGGQGVVYRAEQLSTRRPVAIKVLLGGPLASKDARRRFEREVDVVAHLRHPGIVTIHDSGTTDDGCPFYVMEFVDGDHLDRHLRAHRYTVDEGLALFASICDAVIHAHRNGVIHRDLKPSNIIVGKGGAPRVLDFGLAKTAQASDAAQLSVAGQVVGTFAYMAPEQARGESDRIDIRTDVYALGVILYEILAGAEPYPVDGHLDEILRHIKRTVPEPPSRARGRPRGARAEGPGHRAVRCPIDDDLDTIVLKALAKDPDRRFQTVAMFAEDLTRSQDGRPIESKRDSHLYVLRRTLGRHRGPVAAAIVLVILIVAFATMMTVLYARADFERHRAERALVALRETAYFGTIALAQNAHESRNTFQLIRLLEDCPRDLRNWEWRYLARLSDSSLSSLIGHERYDTGPHANVRVAVSPDGALLASGGLDQRIVLWDAASGERLRTLEGHTHFVVALNFSPDSRFVASASFDGDVRIWSVEDGATVHRFGDGGGIVRTVAYARDGRHVASGAEDGGVRVWDTATGDLEMTLVGHVGPVGQVVWSPDGARLVSAGWDRTVRVWDAETGASEAVLEGHTDSVWFVAHDPLRDRVASGGIDRTIRLWDLTTGLEIGRIDSSPDQLMSLSFSPDGTHLACGIGLSVRIWDSETGAPVSTMLGHEDRVVNVVYAPDGQTLYSGAADTTIRAWDADFAEPVVLDGHEGMVRDVAISGDGRVIATASRDGRVRLWDRDTLALRVELEGDSMPLDAVALRGARVAAPTTLVASSGYSRTIIVHDVQRTAITHELTGHEHIVGGLAFTPDGNGLVSASWDGTVREWSLDEGREVRQLDERSAVAYRVVFSRAGDRLASSWGDSRVLVRSWPSGELVHELRVPDGTCLGVAFSPDGSLVAAACEDRTIRIWDTRSGEPTGALRGHNSIAQTVGFTADGTRIISGGFDNLIMIWDHVSGRCALTLRGHEAGIPQIAVAPDGDWFVSASNDRTARVWAGSRPGD